jgi:hypothetical protein
VSRQLCVAYAGSALVALDALRRLPVGDSFDLEEVESLLSVASRRYDRATDFLVASLREPRSLAKIQDGEVLRGGDQWWIGEPRAFNAYQRYFHEQPAIASSSEVPFEQREE